ncbi:hypothetical protein N2599_31535 (plasmid) [Rhizobium sullae]|uniref:Uncharacterized protein n=2 Tax=Rhizobium sullae TaxID=50338 RepID=A0ABY5XY43_RHISU|nr:hypothetical protein [Rhizobium sullae]UWU19044.1 hypothetical protein N2599_31535 [Rhizobium sullae]
MVPSFDWFIDAFVRKEAVISSQVEGTPRHRSLTFSPSTPKSILHPMPTSKRSRGPHVGQLRFTQSGPRQYSTCQANRGIGPLEVRTNSWTVYAAIPKNSSAPPLH